MTKYVTKELTYEDWQKNPTPRMMWVWDNGEMPKKRKVVYILRENCRLNRVITVDNNDFTCEPHKHCAEIEEPTTRRMTNKELSWWLRGKPTRECKWTFNGCICSVHTYNEKWENEEVHKDVRIREDDGEWREPLVEVEE